jgi:hypothetical protein
MTGILEKDTWHLIFALFMIARTMYHHRGDRISAIKIVHICPEVGNNH